MGLAPYGDPKYAQLILDRLVDLKPDGTFRVDQSYFDYCTGLRMTNDQFDKLFGGKPRRSEDPISQREMDIAASIQAVTEEVVLRLTRALAAETGMANLCLAGGVALNCVANGKVLREGKFKRIWIQPAAGDAGGALGAALAAYHIHSGRPRRIDNRLDGMSGAYLGPAYDADSIRASLDSHRAHYEELDADALEEEVAAAIDQEKVVGWFQGRMEFGPRALGNRSILAKATSPKMQSVLNLKIKYRESFRPFAPAVLRDDLAEWFDMDVDSPYMLLVADVAERRRRKLTAAEEALFGIAKLNVPRSDIPAVTHVDYSARVQTVHADTNPRFHRLLEKVKARTGASVVVNTSFNVRDEPIVCTPDDAYGCFMATEMDVLAIGNFILRKSEQRPRVAATAGAENPLFPAELLACLKPPGGEGESLERIEGAFRCPETGALFPDLDGVPSLLKGTDFERDDVTGRVKAFYEENPFPNYEGVEEFSSLVSTGLHNSLTSTLLDAIGYNKLILECGCGTGQMTNFLSLNNNHVLGVDLSLSSLGLALEHKLRNGLRRPAFAQMNIFDLAVKDESFDVVISTGVLHHTRDARRAFAAITRKAKPGGIVVVGLYNAYGRVPTFLRSKLIGVLGPNIDHVVRTSIRDPRKADIWIKDQYFNPHETWHSMDEVLVWFDENGVRYLNCRPSLLGSNGEAADGLFSEGSPGNKAQRVATQLSWLTTNAREGALFIMIGRRET
jgi:predicted NodU family carbamoyl transferase/2-polyprenyl-3-methyl-5-hydroxy-6-metoxy-1,4-benzoquinol methylase